MSDENNFKPTLEGYKPLRPFNLFMKNNFPFIENTFEALDTYGLLCQIVKYLNTVIENTNTTEENINILSNAFNELNDYVSHYFDNLDVQEEINNKLDDMAESGELEEIISYYLNSNAIFCFNSVNDLKSATNLLDGSYARTVGYYSVNDGGGALYKISEATPSSYYETLNNGLYAMLVEFTAKPEMFGAKGDGETDDTTALQNCFNYSNKVELGKNKTYLVTDTLSLNIDNYNMQGNKSKIIADFATDKLIIEAENDTNGIIENIEIEGGINTGGIRVSENSNAIIKNSRFLNLGLYGVSRFKYVGNCYFYNCARKTGATNGHGMIYAGKDNVTYENNEFYALDGDGLDHCIYAGGGQHHDIQILNNKCVALEGCTQGPLLALYLSDNSEQSDNIHYNCVVRGNIFDYRNGPTNRAGVVIEIKNSNVTDNIFYGSNVTSSLWLQKSLENNISNNQFINGFIQVTDARKTNFSNNTLKECTKINLKGSENSLYGFIIQNNNLINTSIILDTASYCSGISILNNRIEFVEKAGNGIFMNNSGIISENITISGNIIMNCSGYGILARYLKKIKILNNIIMNYVESYTTNRGIDLQYNDDFTDSIIANNSLFGSFYEGYPAMSFIFSQRNGCIVQNNYGNVFGNGMLTAYPENGSANITNHTPYYIGELLNLSGVIYIAKGVTNPNDWVQLSN